MIVLQKAVLHCNCSTLAVKDLKSTCKEKHNYSIRGNTIHYNLHLKETSQLICKGNQLVSFCME